MLTDELYNIGKLPDSLVDSLTGIIKKSMILGMTVFCEKAYSLENDKKIYTDVHVTIPEPIVDLEVYESIPYEGNVYIIPSKNIPTMPDNGLLMYIPNTITCLGYSVNKILRRAIQWLTDHMEEPADDAYSRWVKIIGGENVEHLRATFKQIGSRLINVDIDFRDFKSHKLKTMDYCFCSHYGNIGFESLDMNNVESMRYTFANRDVSNIIFPFDGINTKSVKDMTGIFMLSSFIYRSIKTVHDEVLIDKIGQINTKDFTMFQRDGLPEVYNILQVLKPFDFSSVENLRQAFDRSKFDKLDIKIVSQNLKDIERIFDRAFIGRLKFSLRADNIERVLLAFSEMDVGTLNLSDFHLPTDRIADENLKSMFHKTKYNSITLGADNNENTLALKRAIGIFHVKQ